MAQVCGILVVFHMQGCPHCPPAIEAARQMRGVHVVGIGSEHSIVDKLGIQSFPTIWLALPHDIFDYGQRHRKVPDMQEWIRGKLETSIPSRL